MIKIDRLSALLRQHYLLSGVESVTQIGLFVLKLHLLLVLLCNLLHFKCILQHFTGLEALIDTSFFLPFCVVQVALELPDD